ncbi:T/G mismatch-specific endonuclease [Rhizobium sp. NFR03]|nr:T/G mismatch-specific endonuclease [Rhizobium sp. NFR03]
MQRTARKDNPFERAVRSQLYARRFRYRIHHKIPGLKRTSCDFAFPGLKIAIFLDGCFWHGCELHPPSVKKNTDFWLSKIARNRARDARATAHLTEIGWTVLRFWEHGDVATIVESIAATVEAKKASASPHRGASTLQDVQRSPGKFEAVDRDV